MFSDLPVCCSLDACSHLEMMSQIWKSFGRHTCVKRTRGFKKRRSRDHRAHLDASLQAVLQLSPGRVVGVQAEPREAGFPDAGVLVEAALELVHGGRRVKAHHL